MINSAIDYLYSKSEIIKFAGVGILATLTHSSVYLAYLKFFDSSPQLGNLLGFFVAVIVSYTGQRYWTFSQKNVKNELASKIKFVISSITSLVLNAFWVYLTVNWFVLPPEYSVVGILFLTPIIIFILLKYWVFT
ncbi:MAG: GtrA family protein [Aureibaculum sp.]|nr:GtrA family protein [Aureibaculum sp.]